MAEAQRWLQLEAEIVACRRCPRLVAWREQAAAEKRRMYRDWTYWGRPVPGFGDENARLLIVGLAPAAHGANRTGRMFTGDTSANTLMAALHRAGFANQDHSRRRGDGLELGDAYITNVVRCAPPQNRPNAGELANCRPFLARELALLADLGVVLTLGQIAFDGYVRLLRGQGHDLPRLKFGHGLVYEHPGLPALVTCYHPSRQNTNTGRLTDAMMDEVMAQVQRLLAGA